MSSEAPTNPEGHPTADALDAFSASLACRALTDPKPRLVALAGAVGVGKTTLATRLAERLNAHDISCSIVSTDGFLLPNIDLDARGLLYRKGFPESYDHAKLNSVVGVIRAGFREVAVPRYSHLHFDVDGAEVRVIGDVVLFEGVNALQPPLVDVVDERLYLHADEPVVRAWFVTRMLGLIDAAATDPNSFYAQFVALDDAHRRSFAVDVWERINLPNLIDHIAPSAARADLVLGLDEHHRIVEAAGPEV